MSAVAVRLSPAVKALISAPHARGSALPCPDISRLTATLDTIRSKGESGGISVPSWLTLSTAALVTSNSPATLCQLYSYAVKRTDGEEVRKRVEAAAVIRESALKCISFSGIPRASRETFPLASADTIDHQRTHGFSSICSTGCHRAVGHHAPSVSRTPRTLYVLEGLTRSEYSTTNIDASNARGRGLWDAIYEPHSTKLLQKLSDAHPDLPIHILTSHYSNLLSDPFGSSPTGGAKVGRVLTSVVAMACLRAQTGVSPQLTSHVFGLKKALLEGGGADGETALPGQEWLTSDKGVEWILESTDAISELVGEGQVSFASPMRRDAKL